MRAPSLVALLLLVPLASAAHPVPWGTPRQEPHDFPAGPHAWVPPNVVHGETVAIHVRNFPTHDIRVEVLRPEDRAVLQDVAYAPYGSDGGTRTGYAQWVPARELGEGRRVLRVSGGGESWEQGVVVWEAPAVFVRQAAPPPWGERLVVEAVGFDDAPVTAELRHAGLSWRASWDTGRGPDMAIGAPAAVEPGAWPPHVIGATDGDQSVVVSVLALAPDGGPLRIWFNGTVGGEPRVLTFDATMPRLDTPRVLLPEARAYAGHPLRILAAGLDGPATITLGNRSVEALATHGMLVADIVVEEPGEHLLMVVGRTRSGEPFHEERFVQVNEPPQMVGVGDGLGTGRGARVAAGGAVVAALALAVVALAVGPRAR